MFKLYVLLLKVHITFEFANMLVPYLRKVVSTGSLRGACCLTTGMPQFGSRAELCPLIKARDELEGVDQLLE